MSDFKSDNGAAEGLPAVLQVGYLCPQEVHKEVCVEHHIESLEVHKLFGGFGQQE